MLKRAFASFWGVKIYVERRRANFISEIWLNLSEISDYRLCTPSPRPCYVLFNNLKVDFSAHAIYTLGCHFFVMIVICNWHFPDQSKMKLWRSSLGLTTFPFVVFFFTTLTSTPSFAAVLSAGNGEKGWFPWADPRYSFSWIVSNADTVSPYFWGCCAPF